MTLRRGCGFAALGAAVVFAAACEGALSQGSSANGDHDAFTPSLDAGSSGHADAGPRGADSGPRAMTDAGPPPGRYPAPRPSFCVDATGDRCQRALDRWATEMRSTASREYCTSHGEDYGWVEGHILQGFAYGYLATHDTVFLDKFVERFNGGICRADASTRNDCSPCLFTQHSYDPPTVPAEWGWFGDSYTTDGHSIYDYMVGEGITLQAVVLFIEAVRSDPALAPRYGADADAYLTLLREQLVPKWDRRGTFKTVPGATGAGVYAFQNHSGHLRQDMSLPYNQMFEFSRVLLGLGRITGEPWYRERASTTFRFWVSRKYDQGGVPNWNYWDAAGPWDYNPDGSTKHWVGEEHRCGYKWITSSALLDAWRHCAVIDDAQMRQIIARYDIYDAANHCGTPPMFGFFDEARLERSFGSVEADPTSWGGLVDTPQLMWVMDARERLRHVCPAGVTGP